MKRFSYSSLLRQRLVIAGLTLGLVAVAIGVIVDIVAVSQRTTIPPEVQRLILPLNPQLDVSTVERLEATQQVTLPQARDFVRQAQQQGPTDTPQATPSGTLTPVFFGAELESPESGSAPETVPEPALETPSDLGI